MSVYGSARRLSSSRLDTLSYCSSLPPDTITPGPSFQGNDSDHEDDAESFRRRIQYTSPVSTSAASTAFGPASRTTSRPSTALSTALSRRSRSRAATPSVLGHTEAHDIICALGVAREVSPSVGVAFLNMTLGEVVLSQICDNQSYVKTIHKIQMASPSRIIFPSTTCPPNRPGTLYLLVKDIFPEVAIDSLERSAWSEEAGMDYLQSLGIQSDIEPIKVAIQGKFYAVPCFAAIMRYIESHFTVNIALHSLRIRYQPSDHTMMIDICAIQSLEIMQNMRNAKSKDSLFGLLNHTVTPMGSRMLRNNVLQPPTCIEVIGPRYDALEELVSNVEMFKEIRRVLKLFHDTEKLLTKLIITSSAASVPEFEGQMTQVLMVKSFLEAVPQLYRALRPAQSTLLVNSRNICHPEITTPILESIRRIIEADVKYSRSPLDLRNQRTFAVKSGINGMLDVARMTYKELTEEIHLYVDELNGQYRLGAGLKYDNGRKYWLRVRMADIEDGRLPPVLINIVRKRDIIECQTLDLVKLNQRLSDASNEVAKGSYMIIQGLARELRGKVPELFKVCESVALVDMMSAFGQLATSRDYVRPEILPFLALNAARHPILDKNMALDFVPNDYYASEEYCFHVVTGCNMSGKSTYIRAVALLQIMAQIGSFVPAQYASFSIVHSIFARVSLDDKVVESLSTFSVEMREMAFILQNVDEKSLAIIDELGRGTGTRDGLAIAIAMSEALIASRASVWFATHFVEVARLFGNHAGVLNLHLKSDTLSSADGLPQLVMRYKADGGIVDAEQYYGINLARAMGLPTSVIQRAEEVARDLREKRKANEQSSESHQKMVQRKLMSSLYEALKQALESDSEEALQGYLAQLQEEFIVRMAEVSNL